MNPRIRIFRTGIVFAAAYATLAYVMSSYIESLFGKSAIAPAFTLEALFSLVLLACIPSLLRVLSVKHLLIVFAGAECVLTCALGTSAVVAHSVSLFYLLFALYAGIAIGMIVLLDILIEHYSPRAQTGKIRGIYQSLYSTGWLLGPLASGYLLSRFGFPMLFVVSGSLFALALLSLLRADNIVPKRLPTGFLSGIKSLRGRTDLMRLLSVVFILELFYALMVIYSPVYLREIFHLSWGTIGILFTIMLLPFVVIEYPLGRLADKIGERKLLLLGLLVALFATLAFGALSRTPHATTLALGAVLLCTRIGAATIEIMTQTYFFKQISENESSLISLFRDMTPLAYLTASLLGGILLTTLGFSGLFALVAGVLGAGILITIKLHDTK